MAGITIDYLRAKHAELTAARKENQKTFRLAQEQEIGYKYVLGELEAMIAALEAEAPPPEAKA